MKSTVVAFLVLSLLAAVAAVSAAGPAPEKRIAITVTSKGFEPASIQVQAGQPVVLVVTRTTDKTCVKEFVIADRKVKKALPLNRAVTIPFKADKPGAVRFACGMDMVAGELLVR